MTNINIDLDGSRIAVRFPYDAVAVAMLKTVPGANWSKTNEQWTVPQDLTTCHTLRDIFGDNLVIGNDLRNWAWSVVRSQRNLADLSAADDAVLDVLPTVLPELAEALYPYQRAGVKFIASSPAPLVADQPGLGKTLQVIAGIGESGLLKGDHLIVAPKTALDTVWGREILRWGRGDIFVCTGNRKEREQVIADFLDSDEETRWLVVNPAMVRRKSERVTIAGVERRRERPSYPDIANHEWTTVTIDECHDNGTKNPKTLTAKGMYTLNVVEGGKRIAMSGTPMTNHPIDMWGHLHFLHPDEFTSRWRWAEQWLVVRSNGFGKEIKGIQQGKENEFFKSLAPYVLRRTKGEVLTDLPPKTHVDVWCDMTPKQARLYKTFAEQAAAKIGDFSVSATNILAELTRLKQFADAYQNVLGTDRDDKPILEADWAESGKREYLADILAERGIVSHSGSGKIAAADWAADDDKVIIFSQFTGIIDGVAEWLREAGVGVATITGATPAEDRKGIQERFQNGTDIQVIVMNVKAGGTAITLDRASTVVFLDETWSPAHKEQAEDRAHRASRIHNVTIYTLRSKGTIEETIMVRLDGKRSAHQFILDERRTLELWTDMA